MSGTESKETTNDIVEQTRRIKAALAESMDFDIDRILEDARQKQKEGRRTVLSAPRRREA